MEQPAAQENTVTLAVELPAEMTKTKAIGDNPDVEELIYEVWRTGESGNIDANSTRLYQKTLKLADGQEHNKWIVTLNLVQNQTYKILFWAQDADADVYNTDNLTAVTYENQTNVLSNQENYEAFYKSIILSTDEPLKGQTIVLTRPFAQLNIGTLNTAVAGEYSIALLSSEVKVTVPTVFNVETSAVSEPVEMIFKDADVLKENLSVSNTAYQYVAMNYVFAGKRGENGAYTSNVEYTIQTKVTPTAATSVTDATVHKVIPSVPFEENFRTNIVGNLLTTSAQYEVVVDANFNKLEYVVSDDWTQNGSFDYTVKEDASADVLANILAHADSEARQAQTKSNGPEVTINLNGNVEWKTGAGIGSTPLLPEDSPISKVTINGNGKTFTATGSGVGQIRLANGALLTFNKVKVVDESVSYAENNWEYGYLEFGGKLYFVECEFVNAIMIEGTSCAFEDCSFNSNKDNEYAVWVNEGDTGFFRCNFSGARGLKVHEAYGSDVTLVHVANCLFNQISTKPGIALGDLNENTQIIIKNSTFDRCQAGDQGNYMYETDTEINTFKFTAEGNTVIPSGDAYVVQEDGSLIVSSAAGLNAAIAAVPTNGTIRLANGVYEGLFYVNDKSLNIEALEEGKANINGKLAIAASGKTVNVKGIVFENSYTGSVATGHQYLDKTGKYCIGLYCASVNVENCTFNLSDNGAINFYAVNAPERCTVKNSTFNCNGFRPILSKADITVDGCTFNDQYKYALQVWGNANTGNESVVFTNNKINNPGQTSGCEDVYKSYVSVSKSYELANVTFTISGNTEGYNFVYDNNENVNITSCKLNNKDIVAGQCYAVASDINEVALNYQEGYTYVATAEGLQAAINAQSANILLMPGTYEGTFAMKSNVTIEGQEGATVGCINLNGANNVTLKNITFDAAGAQYSYDGSDNAKQKANIISAAKGRKTEAAGQNIHIYKCAFTGTFNGGGVAMSFTDQRRTGSGNVTIEECSFNTTGGYCDIYGHYFGNSNNFVVKNNIFNSSVMNQSIYMGRYASSVPVVVTGNAFNTKATFETAFALQSHSESYTVSVDASNNTFAE